MYSPRSGHSFENVLFVKEYDKASKQQIVCRYINCVLLFYHNATFAAAAQPEYHRVSTPNMAIVPSVIENLHFL